METGGGEVRDRETDGDGGTKRKRQEEANEGEGRSLRVLAMYFVIAGAYAGINVTNFDDLCAHRSAPVSRRAFAGTTAGNFSPIERERSA